MPFPTYTFSHLGLTMRLSTFANALGLASAVLAVPQKRDESQFHVGQPIDANGKGGPILGMFCIPSFP